MHDFPRILRPITVQQLAHSYCRPDSAMNNEEIENSMIGKLCATVDKRAADTYDEFVDLPTLERNSKISGKSSSIGIKYKYRKSSMNVIML